MDGAGGTVRGARELAGGGGSRSSRSRSLAASPEARLEGEGFDAGGDRWARVTDVRINRSGRESLAARERMESWRERESDWRRDWERGVSPHLHPIAGYVMCLSSVTLDSPCVLEREGERGRERERERERVVCVSWATLNLPQPCPIPLHPCNFSPLPPLLTLHMASSLSLALSFLLSLALSLTRARSLPPLGLSLSRARVFSLSLSLSLSLTHTHTHTHTHPHTPHLSRSLAPLLPPQPSSHKHRHQIHAAPSGVQGFERGSGARGRAGP